MALPRGRSIPLSPMRRFMGDFLHHSRKVPLVAVERRLDLSAVLAARRSAQPRPSWFAVFLKGWAIVSERRTELRRSYLSFPRARLHEHALNVASVAIAREVGGESVVLFHLIRYPERLSLAEIDEQIRRARTDPPERFKAFVRQRRVARLPWPLRRWAWWVGLCVSGKWRARFAGTFGVTGVGALGSASLQVLSPLTTTITYGVIADDGSVTVRLYYDHRVLDGVQPAQAVRELEEVLNGAIADELRGSSRAAA